MHADLSGLFLCVYQEREEQKLLRLQQKENLEAEQKRLNEERQKREVLRRKQELQEIEKKQAMDKIAALKKTTVGAKALKDLTEEVMRFSFFLLLMWCPFSGMVIGKSKQLAWGNSWKQFPWGKKTIIWENILIFFLLLRSL